MLTLMKCVFTGVSGVESAAAHRSNFSMTSTLIARVVDPDAGGTGGIAMAANRVTNRAEADQVLYR